MKRRTFISTLAALAAAPVLPTSAGASASASHITQHFAKAKLLARCHDRASPEMFARLMKLDADTAQGVFNLLKDRSVVASGTDGIARAINPLNTHCVPNEAIRARDLAQVSKDIATRLKGIAKHQHNKANSNGPVEQDPIGDAGATIPHESNLSAEDTEFPHKQL